MSFGGAAGGARTFESGTPAVVAVVSADPVQAPALVDGVAAGSGVAKGQIAGALHLCNSDRGFAALVQIRSSRCQTPSWCSDCRPHYCCVGAVVVKKSTVEAWALPAPSETQSFLLLDPEQGGRLTELASLCTDDK